MTYYREYEEGDRVRSLDDGYDLYGTVLDVGGSVADGMLVVTVAWDNGTRERRLGEDVALVRAAS